MQTENLHDGGFMPIHVKQASRHAVTGSVREMHRVPLYYTPKDCVQAAESWLRSCKDPLKRSPETPLHHGSEPCPGRAAGSVSAPAGHLKPVLTTPDLVPGLGTVTTVCHVHVRHPGPGPGRLPTEWEVLRKGVNVGTCARVNNVGPPGINRN